MTFYHLAFFMGLAGSLHCVMMCGPLMLAIPQNRESFWGRSWLELTYQLGRVLTYSLLGFFLAYIGSLGSLVKNGQQIISLLTGGILVVAGLMSWFNLRQKAFYKMQQRFLQPVFKAIGYWLHKPGGHFFAGMLNGLLPCGMVYMALASALNAESAAGGAFFMMLFGLGTIPLLIVLTISASYGKQRIRLNFNKWLPGLFILMGVWFLLRGANLDISFLSPLIYPEGAM